MLIELVILALAIPVGYLVAWMTRDELVSGRKWFKVLILVGVTIGGWFYLTGEKAIAWTSGFVVVVAFVSYLKSFGKNKI